MNSFPLVVVDREPNNNKTKRDKELETVPRSFTFIIQLLELEGCCDQEMEIIIDFGRLQLHNSCGYRKTSPKS